MSIENVNKPRAKREVIKMKRADVTKTIHFYRQEASTRDFSIHSDITEYSELIE